MAGGALVGLILFAVDFLVGGSGFLGMRDPRVIAGVLERARLHAALEHGRALLVLVGMCAAFGFLGSGFTRRKFLGGVGGALIGHSLFLLRSMAQFPALYAGSLPVITLPGVDLVIAAALLAAGIRRNWRLTVVLATLVGISLGLSMLHRTKKGHGPNVLVLAVDSLRPDRAFDPRFPSLYRLGERGVRFTQAHVTQARTFPSLVSLLTGRWPKHHGIRHEFPTAAARAAIGPTLLDQLSGWRRSVISDFSGEIFSRAPMGFQEIDVPRLDLYAIIGEQVLNAHVNVLPYASTRLGRRLFPSTGIMAELEEPMALAERAGAQIDRGGPFFLMVFFSAPHTPYAAPSPWWQRFADPEYRGPYRYLKQPLPQLAVLPEPEVRQVQALYDGAVGAVDDAIGHILARLEANGLSDETIVVLLGDHGENLFDVPGRGMGHGDHLWGDFGNHIPLVIVDPSEPPREVDSLVREIDLAPTLARRLGVELPGDGRDLFAGGPRESFEETGLWLLTAGPGYRKEDRLPYPDLWHITEAAADGDIQLQPKWEQPVIEAKVRALRTEGWKLVYQPTPSGNQFRLFDLAADPLERNDVAAAHPDVTAELRARLLDWIR